MPGRIRIRRIDSPIAVTRAWEDGHPRLAVARGVLKVLGKQLARNPSIQRSRRDDLSGLVLPGEVEVRFLQRHRRRPGCLVIGAVPRIVVVVRDREHGCLSIHHCTLCTCGYIGTCPCCQLRKVY